MGERLLDALELEERETVVERSGDNLLAHFWLSCVLEVRASLIVHCDPLFIVGDESLANLDPRNDRVLILV